MPAWLARLALALFTLIATVFAGGVMLGAASADTRVSDLLATCLSCGEEWLFMPSATMGAGFLSMFRRRKVDRCPKCGSRAVSFGHAGDAGKRPQGRNA